MATKEDILEQIVEEYLSLKGYFIRHNVKYKPDKLHADFSAKNDSNHSDIDVLAFNPLLEGASAVWAVSCKSWQGGFPPAAIIREIETGGKRNGRETWKGFRELIKPHWSEAFCGEVVRLTGRTMFTHVTAVSRLSGPAAKWEAYEPFSQAIGENPIKIITFRMMMTEIEERVLGTTMASTEIGRLLQIVRASGLRLAEV